MFDTPHKLLSFNVSHKGGRHVGSETLQVLHLGLTFANVGSISLVEFRARLPEPTLTSVRFELHVREKPSGSQ